MIPLSFTYLRQTWSLFSIWLLDTFFLATNYHVQKTFLVLKNMRTFSNLNNISFSSDGSHWLWMFLNKYKGSARVDYTLYPSKNHRWALWVCLTIVISHEQASATDIWRGTLADGCFRKREGSYHIIRTDFNSRTIKICTMSQIAT